MSFTLFWAVVSTAVGTGSPPLYDDEITNAISMIATELSTRHTKERCWEPIERTGGWLTKYEGGTTALTTLAMLSSGHSVNTPIMQNSIAFLSEIKQPSTYVLATRTSIWSMMPKRQKRNLKNDTRRLISTMGLQAGSWGNFDTPPKMRSDASPLNREFGMIALREAQRCGQRVPKKCWMAIAEATLATQQQCGGWSYGQSATKGTPTANMTVAALNCLLGVDELCGIDLSKEQSLWLHNSIEKALAWLNKNAQSYENVGGTTLMSYLYGLERAAMSCGLAEIHKRDWFQDGARAVIKTHCGVRKAKGSTINLSFALLFLSRGRVPIAMCELAVDKGSIDPLRTSEIITTQVSDQTERAFSWRTVTRKEKLDAWLAAPLLFLHDVRAVPTNIEPLQEYLDSGGLLVMLGARKDFQDFSELATILCPKITAAEVDDTHWSLSVVRNVSKVKVTAWNDGIRDRILLVQGTAESLVRSPKTTLSRVLVNICCGAAELGRWKARASRPVVSHSKKIVWIAQHEGNWEAELKGMHRWNWKSKPITQLKKKNLILVGGIHNDEATTTLADEIYRVASAGSTVLVESIGGIDSFALAIQKEIEEQFKNKFVPDDRFNPITQRGWSIRNAKTVQAPVVSAVGEGSIVIANCDIRNALLDHTAWGIHGYSPKFAAQLIDTLLEE
ncbi:MAG: hypothetical protein H8E86_08450 [Planctomycetes bacterium]|nr:hypothetical protein [Planctomycetota bacterium]